MKRFAFIPALIGIFLLCGNGLGQTKKEIEEAEERFFKGKKLIEADQYDKAILEFKESYRLNPAPTVLYNIAVCYEILNRYADAAAYIKECLDKGKDKIKPEQKKKAEQKLEELEGFIGGLKIEVSEAGAAISVDGKDSGEGPTATITVDVGKHEILVKKPGFKEWKGEVNVVSGKTKKVIVTLVPISGVKAGDAKGSSAASGLAVLSVKCKQKNATVLIDGKEAAGVPMRKELESGFHEVKVSAKGFDAWSDTIDLKAGENYTVDIQLTKKKAGKSLWWLWATLGVVVGGGVAAAIAAGLMQEDEATGSLATINPD